MIRGPSYHREVEAGSYPRPMEVNRVQVVDVGGGDRGKVGGKAVGGGLMGMFGVGLGMGGKGMGIRRGGGRGVGRVGVVN